MTIIQSPSPNRRPRRPDTKIDCIVLHDTGGKTAAGTLAWFKDPTNKDASSHYLVDRNGDVYQCVPDAYRAWHAGESLLWGRDDVNEFSLGVEIVDNDDTLPYPAPQLTAVSELVAMLCEAYDTPLNRVVGHEHIATPRGRKADPGRDFPWYQFLIGVGDRLAG